jgi:uncharacterized membrane protein
MFLPTATHTASSCALQPGMEPRHNLPMTLPFGEQIILGLTLASALGTGLVGGVFFVFSTSIMRALARLPAAQGIAAMQSINIAVINPLFLAALFGTAALCAWLATSSLKMWGRPGAGYLLAGGLLYLGGAILVTVFFNVPLNDALARLDPAVGDNAVFWNSYLSTWTAWNHLRTVASLSAAALLTVARCQLAREGLTR